MDEILEAEDLYLYFRTSRGDVRAVDGVSFSILRGETLAVIGESGCGKTSLARALMRYLPRNVSLYRGKVIIDGINVIKLSDREFDEKIRWVKISYVSQAAMNSLNPVIKVVDHLIEPLILREMAAKEAAIEKAKEMLKLVGIPEDFLYRYPFELSGGMRQRVVIALSLITKPNIVILDEPTSALDVMTQANIINLLKKLKRELRLTYIFITHDIGTSSELADKVAVMYAGKIVEFGSSEQVYVDPLHPYSKALLNSVPRLHEERIPTFVPGAPPSLINPPKGCRFRPRCPNAMPICEKEPPLIKINKESYVQCWLYTEK
ncbi:MAG: ABC transporter ATP-binding protein [Thermoprotei archaeon]|nr:MAG: ABC transporter ATP-binding protein [Thermoprotei archaeon]